MPTCDPDLAAWARISGKDQHVLLLRANLPSALAARDLLFQGRENESCSAAHTRRKNNCLIIATIAYDVVNNQADWID
jgi:hypothetical protein